MKTLLRKKWIIASLAVFLTAALALPFLLGNHAVSAERGSLANPAIDAGDTITAYGVDISFWQQEVDFDALYQAGADFVILRAGFSTTEDSFFEENYRLAKQAGLDVGAYWFSYALSEEEAEAEAEACMQVLAGKTFEYPIYFDYEYEPQSTFSAEKTEALCLRFIEKLTQNGYYTGLYSSLNWLRYLIPEQPLQTYYPVWMAMFSNSRTYELYESYCSTYGMWQYSESGQVAGVDGEVDMDICFVDYPAIIRAGGWNGYEPPQQRGDLYVSAQDLPELLSAGDSFFLHGTVNSRSDMLYSVTARITDEAGNVLQQARAECYGTTFDLDSLHPAIDFSLLKAGSYQLRLSAQTEFAELTVLRRSFYVSSPLFDLAQFSAEAFVPQEEPFTMTGILSAASIEEVLIEIYSAGSFDAVYTEVFTPQAEQFDLSAWEGASDLAPGIYSCVVSAATELGSDAVICREFVVCASQAELPEGDYEWFAESLTYADLDRLSLHYTLRTNTDGTCSVLLGESCLTTDGSAAPTFEKDYCADCQCFLLQGLPDGGYLLLGCENGLYLQLAEDGSFYFASTQMPIYFS